MLTSYLVSDCLVNFLSRAIRYLLIVGCLTPNVKYFKEINSGQERTQKYMNI